MQQSFGPLHARESAKNDPRIQRNGRDGHKWLKGNLYKIQLAVIAQEIEKACVVSRWTRRGVNGPRSLGPRTRTDASQLATVRRPEGVHSQRAQGEREQPCTYIGPALIYAFKPDLRIHAHSSPRGFARDRTYAPCVVYETISSCTGQSVDSVAFVLHPSWLQNRVSCTHGEARWRSELRPSPRHLESSWPSRSPLPVTVTLDSGFSRFAV